MPQFIAAGAAAARLQKSASTQSVHMVTDVMNSNTVETGGALSEKFDADKEEVAEISIYWHLFTWGVHITIILNFAMLGLQLEHKQYEVLWGVLEHVCTAIFASEMLIKIYVLRFAYFKDPWHLFDCALTWMSMIDVWFLMGADSALRGTTALRVMRIGRIFRALRILEIKQELSLLVGGLIASVKALTWIILLLVIVIYTGALFVMSALDPSKYDATFAPEFGRAKWFGSIPESMLTLFNVCLLTEWAEVARPIYDQQIHVFIFLMFYVFLVTFAILNLVIGVIAERTMDMAAQHTEEMEQERKRLKMTKIVRLAEAIFDEDDDKGLEIHEMMDVMRRHSELKSLLMSCGLPHGFDIGDLHLIFDEKHEGVIDKNEFLNGMFRIIFNNQFQRDCCTLLTVAQVKSDMKTCFKELKEEIRTSTWVLRDVEELQRATLGPPLLANRVSSAASAASASDGGAAKSLELTSVDLELPSSHDKSKIAAGLGDSLVDSVRRALDEHLEGARGVGESLLDSLQRSLDEHSKALDVAHGLLRQAIGERPEALAISGILGEPKKEPKMISQQDMTLETSSADAEPVTTADPAVESRSCICRNPGPVSAGRHSAPVRASAGGQRRDT